ncbi:FG-GAP-like repeat-containing protein [bacterium]|nr:FG-GAP-like repeat-containing protein [bacterium]
MRQCKSHTSRIISPRRVSAAALVLTLSIPPIEAAAISVDLTSEMVPVLSGASQGDEFGYSFAVGDINGDGASELAIGAPGRRVSLGQTNEPDDTASWSHAGAVYVFDCEALGRALAGDGVAAALQFTHPHSGSRFGSELLFLDIDGNGTDELLIAAPDGAPQGEIRTGQVFVFDMADSAWVAPGSRDSGDALTVLTGDGSGDGFGTHLEACDIDGDGRPELIVSAPGADVETIMNAGLVYIFDHASLAVSGISRASRSAIGILSGAADGDAVRTVRTADFDGDGCNELIIGAHQVDVREGARQDAGAVYVVPTKALEFRAQDSEDAIRVFSAATAATDIIAGGDARAFLGRAIAVGDVDGDGVDDLLISSHTAGRSDKRSNATGAAYLVFGGSEGETSSPPDTLWNAPPARSEQRMVVTFRGRSMWDIFGLASLIRDLNNDGFADIAIAAQFVDGFDRERESSGEIYLYWGSLRSVMEAKAGSAEKADAILVGNIWDTAGGALASLDFTGDGRLDLIVGAPHARGDEQSDRRRGKVYFAAAELLLAR